MLATLDRLLTPPTGPAARGTPTAEAALPALGAGGRGQREDPQPPLTDFVLPSLSQREAGYRILEIAAGEPWLLEAWARPRDATYALLLPTDTGLRRVADWAARRPEVTIFLGPFRLRTFRVDLVCLLDVPVTTSEVPRLLALVGAAEVREVLYRRRPTCTDGWRAERQLLVEQTWDVVERSRLSDGSEAVLARAPRGITRLTVSRNGAPRVVAPCPPGRSVAA